MNQKQETYRSVADVGRILDVSKRTVVRMIAAGNLPGSFALPLGQTKKTWRIPQSAIDSLVAGGQPEREQATRRVPVPDRLGERAAKRRK